jgi:protein-tyrosine phosphatase
VCYRTINRVDDKQLLLEKRTNFTMSFDPRTSSSVAEQDNGKVAPAVSMRSPAMPAVVAPGLRFSWMRWGSTGVMRVLYRCWTRIAVRLFPENSAGEQLAQALRIPLPDSLNMSWVTDQLAVGGRIRPEDIRTLALFGVTHVVDTRSEYCDDVEALLAENITLLYLPTPDTYPLSVEQLQQGAVWVQERIKSGGRVLIHCEHGVGRSVLLTCVVLVYSGMSAHSALQLVQGKRWQAAPNQRQISRLKEFERVRIEAGNSTHESGSLLP